MMTRLFCSLAVLGVAAAPALGQFVSGSDGSDGALDLAALSALDPTNCPLTCDAANPCTCTIDLGLAIDGTWDTTPGTGNGVYDATQWAVVFKYTTITIPAGVTVKFLNHPKGAPVVWLAQGDVTVAAGGLLTLIGQAGADTTGSVFSRAEPGPGGFAGAARPFVGASAAGGFGPGGGGVGSSGGGGNFENGGGGRYEGVYGNSQIIPPIGGSGGASGLASTGAGSGGAGGGAIVIATSTRILLDGSIQAVGGGGGQGTRRCNNNTFVCSSGGGGSGGAIRLIANTILGNGSLRAPGGAGGFGGSGNNGGTGRIRIEAADCTLGDPNPPNSFPVASKSAAMGPVFPPAGVAATLRVLSIDGQPVAADPDSGIVTVETPFGNAAAVPVVINGINVPDGAQIRVILTPARGNIQVTLLDPLAFSAGSATASVLFPPGRNEIQLRATWTNP